VRYRGAAGGAEKAHSRQRRWCLWSKPVNLGTWGLVPDPIAVAHSFVELGYGTVVHTRENGFTPCEVYRTENDSNRIDAGRRLGSVVRGSDDPV
jgi:hypothetical protein